jgi:hypothetical protein
MFDWMRTALRGGNTACLGMAWLWLLRGCAADPFTAPPATAPFDTAFTRLSPEEVATLPLAHRFVAPMGAENGALTYNARSFRSLRHLGDDLNGMGGWNSDLGDPVYASADGRVVYTGNPSDGWGKMIMIAHRVPDAAEPAGWKEIITLYAHLQSIDVQEGTSVKLGTIIGTVGTAEGKYLAHLHFEVRQSRSLYPGMGYADGPLDRLPPEFFIREHQGGPSPQ